MHIVQNLMNVHIQNLIGKLDMMIKYSYLIFFSVAKNC